MLALANIRKTKGHTVSLLIMFLIASLLMNAGLLVFVNFGSFFEDISKKLNTSDTIYVLPSSAYNQELKEYLVGNNNIEEMHKEELMWSLATTNYNAESDESDESYFNLYDADIDRNITKWKFVGNHLPAEKMSIFLPEVFRISHGYELNDVYNMTIEDIKFSFTIKGFFEDIYCSSTETGFIGLYLPHDTYEFVAGKLSDETHATVIFTNLKEVNQDIETKIKEITQLKSMNYSGKPSEAIFTTDLATIKLSRTMMASMVSMMIVIFAIIIVVVCLIVVRFRIGNSIEDDMTKIGSLKAIGYTSRQIIQSVATQFALIAITGSITGIALSYFATPVLSDVFAQQSGLLWVQEFDGVISSTALSLILLIVILVGFTSARRINKLNPIVALRGGIITHSFQKNYMPLDKSKGRLPIIFALKSLLQNKKQSIMIAFILITVSFAGTFAVVMFYNTAIDATTFYETPGVELSSVVAVFKPEAEGDYIEDIRHMEGVRKAQFIDESVVHIEGDEIGVYVMEDYSQKETDKVYRGRYPIHSNEIVLSGNKAGMLGKTIGDSVLLRVGERENKFIITGLSQGAFIGVIDASITYDGMMKLNTDFQHNNLQIYLEKGTDAGIFATKIEEIYGDTLMVAVDMDKSMKEGAGVYIAIVEKVGIAVLLVTIAVVILVLYFVINSSVTRKKRDLGIQKAIGFTTFQLMNQLSLGLLPPVIAGVCAGSILGATLSNPIMSLAQKGMGVMKADYIITPVWFAIFAAAIVMISYLTSMLITYRIRKISAYALVTE